MAPNGHSGMDFPVKDNAQEYASVAAEIDVFVHLPYHFGAKNWNKKYKDDTIPGIIEPYAYGYHRAQEYGCRVTYSEDDKENSARRLFRLGVRFLLGFDLIHAWRNRKGILGADVVWTHTESQFLAIALIFALLQPKRKPILIGQAVWLIDRWAKYTPAHRWLYRKLLPYAEVLSFHSPVNLKIARDWFPEMACELILYGINTDDVAPLEKRAVHTPLRLLAMGNDEHRDWPTLIAAVMSVGACELKIASSKVNLKLFAGTENVELVTPKSKREVLDLYEWADLVVVSLKPNLHASGITVLEEAAVRGVPAISSDVGGLRAYFSEDAVTYVPAGEPDTLRDAIRHLAADDATRWKMVARARARMGPEGLSSRSYVRRNVELSKNLLSHLSRSSRI